MNKNKKKPFRDYQDNLIERLKNPAYASEYLKAALNEKDMPQVFMSALSHVAKAKGVRLIANHTKLSRETLYRLFSNEGNPTLNSLYAILDALGLKLSVEIKKKAI